MFFRRAFETPVSFTGAFIAGYMLGLRKEGLGFGLGAVWGLATLYFDVAPIQPLMGYFIGTLTGRLHAELLNTELYSSTKCQM